jgi:hypothetical protein
MPPEVPFAMQEASRALVDMFELQRAVSERIAGAHPQPGGTGVHWSVRGPGAVARREIVMQCAQRIPYDPALKLAGGRIVEIGNAVQTFDWELEAALNERTAAVLHIAWCPSRPRSPAARTGNRHRPCPRRAGCRGRRAAVAATRELVALHATGRRPRVVHRRQGPARPAAIRPDRGPRPDRGLRPARLTEPAARQAHEGWQGGNDSIVDRAGAVPSARIMRRMPRDASRLPPNGSKR